MSTTDTNHAACQPGDAAQVLDFHRPEVRSRVDPRPLLEMAQFQDLYVVGDRVRKKGPRGPSGVHIIVAALGNGLYRLDDGSQVQERNLFAGQSSTPPS